MKKILLGLLIVASFTACSNSKVQEIEATQADQVTELSQLVNAQTTEYETLKTDTKELKAQTKLLNDEIKGLKN